MSKLIPENSIPSISAEDLEHISPLHQFCARELIAAGRLKLIEKVSAV